jgi:hypothetical protein
VVKDETELGKEMLIKYVWDVDTNSLTDDELSVWQLLLDERTILPSALQLPPSPKAMEQILAYPCIRGIAKVCSAGDPYTHDEPLRTKVKELGKEGIDQILEDAGGISVKRQRWMTFLAASEAEAEMVIDYLVPTFTMTTLRKTLVVDLYELLEKLKKGTENDEEDRRFLDLKSCSLLVVTSVDARQPLYIKLQGALRWFYNLRGRNGLVTMTVLGPSPAIKTLLANGNINHVGTVTALERLGFYPEDSMSYVLIGVETHVCYIDSEGAYQRCIL